MSTSSSLIIIDDAAFQDECFGSKALEARIRGNLDTQQWEGEVARVPSVEALALPKAGQRAQLREARKTYSNQLKGRGRNRQQRRQLARRLNLSTGGES